MNAPVKTSVVLMRCATVEDLAPIKAIADHNKATLGFVSRGELTKALASDSLLVAELDNQVVGYVCFYRCRKLKPGQFTVNSIAVAATARMRGIGRQLIAALVAMMPRTIVLKCIAGTPANKFYEAIGFINQGSEHKPGRRQLIVWVLDVPGSGIMTVDSALDIELGEERGCEQI